MEKGKLYVVGTPIGNLGDITLRALETLKNVDLVLCEDTRVTRKLLSKYDIHTKTESYHTHSKINKKDYILKLLEEGKSLALVSDAGTPAISDPGEELVRSIREKLGDGVEIIVIPGPSALVSALSISGVSTSEFAFLGFVPHKKGRETFFKKLNESDMTVVFYESSHRIIKTLESLVKFLDKGQKVTVARELTKIYEEMIGDTPANTLKYYESNPDKVRGEFVVIVSQK